MIPPLPTRRISLQPPILNGEHIRKNTLLVHRLPEQLPAIVSARTQLFARAVHGMFLALELKVVRAALLGLVELPGTVDGPVAEVAIAGEAERARGERVPEEVADHS